MAEPPKYTYGYTYEFSGEDEPTFTLELIWDRKNIDYALQNIAEDYDSNHDGWEDDWPVMFTVWFEGEKLGTWSVDKEAVPSFRVIEAPDTTGRTEER